MYLFITGIDSAGSVFITKETLSANRIKIRIETFYHHFQQYLSYIMAVIPLTEETVMSRENYIFLQVIDLKLSHKVDASQNSVDFVTTLRMRTAHSHEVYHLMVKGTDFYNYF